MQQLAATREGQRQHEGAPLPTDPNRLGDGTCIACCHPAGMHTGIAAAAVPTVAQCKRKCEASMLPAHSPAPAVNGSVRCLAMFVDEQGDEQVRRSAAAICCCTAVQAIVFVWPVADVRWQPCVRMTRVVGRHAFGACRMNVQVALPAGCGGCLLAGTLLRTSRAWAAHPLLPPMHCAMQIMAIAPALLPELLGILRRCGS